MADDKKVIFSMVGVSKIYPPQKQVLKDIYLSFFYGAKIGIIGLNGAGKSTLLKIIAGIDKQYQGEVVFSPGYSVGYLEQDPKLDPSKTVKEIVQEGVQPVLDLLKEFDQVNESFADPDVLEDPDKMDKLINRQAELQDVSREIPREEGVTNIVSVGRLSYPKGFDEAIRACRLLLDRGYRIRWYVVGYGEKEKPLRTLIEKKHVEGAFFLLGKKLNPYPYMKACDIYAQPSRYEGKAVTVREAQILARPVLITNFGTAGSQVENGADGYITPLGPEGIADGIAYLIDHPEVCRSLSECAAGRDYGNRGEIKKLYAYLKNRLCKGKMTCRRTGLRNLSMIIVSTTPFNSITVSKL